MHPCKRIAIGLSVSIKKTNIPEYLVSISSASAYKDVLKYQHMYERWTHFYYNIQMQPLNIAW